MEGFEVRKINLLSQVGFAEVVKESKREGFNFVTRLVHDYESGDNRFSLPGEALYGVFNNDGDLVALGGLNQDPFSKQPTIGRLRRFYVRKRYRRMRIGTFLLEYILSKATTHFQLIVLHTDTKEADKFYVSSGFKRGEELPNSSHFLLLKGNEDSE